MEEPHDITRLLAIARAGDPGAVEEVFSLVYEDLRRLAHRQLSRLPSHPTLNTTALVHEAYLKLVHRSSISPEGRRHFFATAAKAMRQIAVDYARGWSAAKRGGGRQATALTTEDQIPDPSTLDLQERAQEILAVNQAMETLTRLNPRMAQVTELRFFGGFSVEETAEVMEISPRTVKRLWQIARAVLHQELHRKAAD